MKIEVHYLENGEEERIALYVATGSTLPSRIRALCEEDTPLVGYDERGGRPLDVQGVLAFVTEGGRVFAVTQTEKLALRRRLFALEELLPKNFLRISQSVIVNLHAIRRFDASLGGALCITLTNGQTEYVSRRRQRQVKERLGL